MSPCRKDIVLPPIHNSVRNQDSISLSDEAHCIVNHFDNLCKHIVKQVTRNSL